MIHTKTPTTFQRTLSGLLLASLLLSGCPSSSDNPESSASPGESASTAAAPSVPVTIKNPRVMEGDTSKPGGTLRIAQYGDPKTFNYVLAKEVSSTGVVGIMFEGLAEQNGVNGNVEPALAEKWDISKDGKTYTFTLRQGLQWSDGQPLTADDVVFTFNDLIANPNIPSDWGDGLKIDGKLPTVTKVDALHVRFNTVKPFAPFLRSVGQTAIMPKHILASTLEPKTSPKFNQFWGLDTDVKSIVGNGPFTIDQFLSGQRVVFKKNPYYWRVDKKGTRLPYFDSIILLIVKDSDTMMLKFKAKEIDILDPVQPKDYELIKQGEQTGDYKVLKGGPDFGTFFLMFNLKQNKEKDGTYAVDPIKQKWFNNVKFRQAVSYAIDRVSIIRNYYSNLAKVQTAAESATSPFFDKQIKGYDYEPQKAAQLLTDAGFKKAGDVLQDAEGHPVEFILQTNANNTVRVVIGSQLVTDLGKLGIKVTFQPMDFNAMVKEIDESHHWESIMIGLTGGVEPNNGTNIWTSKGKEHMFRIDEPAATPWEKEIDKLFEEGAVTMDPKKRKAIYDKYQEIANEQEPFIYTVNQEALAAVRNNIGNMRYTALGQTIWNIYQLYLK